MCALVTPVQEHLKVLNLENVIRTETVLSKLPFHNLSKRETVEILIAREREAHAQEPTVAPWPLGSRLGRYEMYWSVHPNPKYGEPRQLAYDIDTLIINRRLDEIGRPVPRRMRLGSLRSIARELGKEKAGTEDIKRALLQNSSAHVTLKIAFTALDGTVRWAVDHNTRYGVGFRGTTGPDGTTSEGVYITWNDPFLDILNNTKTRPLDYAYLRSLPPAARRFYELTSFLFYAALKRGDPSAEVRYSEYCKLAPQKRITDRHRAQTQMGKLHRPHLQSGYLDAVEYAATTDLDGRRDWIIRYIPGPAAREEFLAFNGNALKASQPPRKAINHANLTQRQARIMRNSAPPEAPSPLLARFLELFPQARRTSRAEELAADLLKRCGEDEDLAVFVVERFARSAEQTGWRGKVADFGALFSQDGRHVDEAIEAHHVASDRRRREALRRVEEEVAEGYNEAAKAWAEDHFLELPADQQERLVEEAARKLRQDIPDRHLRGAWGGDFETRLRDSARARAINRYRDRFPITLDQWKRGVRSADTHPTTAAGA